MFNGIARCCDGLFFAVRKGLKYWRVALTSLATITASNLSQSLRQMCVFVCLVSYIHSSGSFRVGAERNLDFLTGVILNESEPAW